MRSLVMIRMVAMACLLAPACPATAADIVGRWVVVDSESAQRLSTIEIIRDGDQFVGRIVELFLPADVAQDPRCTRCDGAEHDQRVRGMRILWVKPTNDRAEFTGTALDPSEGQIYRCIVTLDGSGKRLSVRGFIGIPLFGRTEDWLRVN